MRLLQKADDIYISCIVKDLSQTLEMLLQLKDINIFPDNEDTLVSKLQSQIVRLVHILRKQSERERQDHENIKGLVSDLSHQLKTPIANLQMYIEFLRADNISEEQRKEYVEILTLSLNRLLFLSESMIKVSRLESGLIKLEGKKQSINDTVLKAIKDSYNRAKDKGIDIRYTEEYAGAIFHDSQWTSEAVFNLIDNAIKYGEAGNTVEVTVRELGTMIEIIVEDENTPIGKDEYNLIFDRFHRGKNSKKTEGVGIGLYLTREISEKQHGYVAVKPGQKGNRFSIVLRKDTDGNI